jgi:hypothetical protein
MGPDAVEMGATPPAVNMRFQKSELRAGGGRDEAVLPITARGVVY